VLDPDEAASRIVVLRGGSSTGKSRSAYQAVTEGPLASWRLERPVTPADLISLLDEGITPQTVVWLEELRHFADADHAAEALGKLGCHNVRSSWLEFVIKLLDQPILGSPNCS
jgi:hypothetical protein